MTRPPGEIRARTESPGLPRSRQTARPVTRIPSCSHIRVAAWPGRIAIFSEMFARCPRDEASAFACRVGIGAGAISNIGSVPDSCTRKGTQSEGRVQRATACHRRRNESHTGLFNRRDASREIRPAAPHSTFWSWPAEGEATGRSGHSARSPARLTRMRSGTSMEQQSSVGAIRLSMALTASPSRTRTLPISGARPRGTCAAARNTSGQLFDPRRSARARFALVISTSL